MLIGKTFVVGNLIFVPDPDRETERNMGTKNNHRIKVLASVIIS